MSVPSLRRRLTGGVVALVAIGFVLAASVLYVSVRRAAWAQFDRAQAARAATLAALVEHDRDDGYEMEIAAPAGLGGGYFQVWLADGTVLARSESLRGGDLPRPATGAAPPPTDVTLPDGRPGRRRVLRFTPRHEHEDEIAPVTLVVADDTEALRATLATIAWWFWGVGAATVLAIAILGGWIVRRGLDSLTLLARELDQIDHRTLATRLPVEPWPDELRGTVRTLNELLERLDASFERERRFTADVSHELRTPLAGLRAMLEVTRLRERSGAEYRATLDDARQIVEQLGGLAETLLTLARLDAGALELGRTEVALAALVDERWRPHAARAAGRGVALRNLVPAEAVIETDRDKLGLILANLLGNAADYTEPGGWIEVTAAEAGVVVDVTDSGPAIPEAQLERVFERFWRADAARTGGAHAGLGLSLVRSLCGHLGWEVTAANLPGGRVRFRVVHRGFMSTPVGCGHASPASSSGTADGDPRLQ